VNPADVLPPITAYYVMRIGTLPLIPYYRPGDKKLAEAVRAVAHKHHAVLLANHGPVVAGSSLSVAGAAVDRAEGKSLALWGEQAKPRPGQSGQAVPPARFICAPRRSIGARP